MIEDSLKALRAEFATLNAVRHVGRVCAVQGGLLQVAGLCDRAKMGDEITVYCRGGGRVTGEVLQIAAQHVSVLPDGPADGVAMGDRAALMEPPRIAPSDAWIGRVIDPAGRPLDGLPLLKGSQARAVKAPPPDPASRRPFGTRLETGFCVFNTALPLVRGQRIGLFAGSGVGKSNLLAGLAQNIEADIVVIALIGERGREVNEFVHKTLGSRGMARSIVVAATSDQAPTVRRRCAETAMAVAEYFRDKGKNVLLLADSITRFAEAHREIALSAGELPALRGYPASTAQKITSLCERAGPGSGPSGDITAVFSVLVAGSDMDEPVADILRGVLDGHVVLDRAIAERGRFPAIDLLRSVSRSLPDAATTDENEALQKWRKLLGAYERSETMIRSGLYTEGSDPVLDMAVKAWEDLDAFVGTREQQDLSHSYAKLKLILKRSAGQNSAMVNHRSAEARKALR